MSLRVNVHKCGQRCVLVLYVGSALYKEEILNTDNHTNTPVNSNTSTGKRRKDKDRRGQGLQECKCEPAGCTAVQS